MKFATNMLSIDSGLDYERELSRESVKGKVFVSSIKINRDKKY